MTQDPFSHAVSQVAVPNLGANQRSITLVNWLVATGSFVIAGERIAELLVDSVLFHLESDVDGKLERVLVPTGSQVKVGQAIAEISLSLTSTTPEENN